MEGEEIDSGQLRGLDPSDETAGIQRAGRFQPDLIRSQAEILDVVWHHVEVARLKAPFVIKDSDDSLKEAA